MTEPVLTFGPYRLLPASRALFVDKRPLRLGGRAFDILIALTEKAGELVSKEDLIARVWPDTYVEDGNIRVHVSALRRVLGEGDANNRYVMNIPGRGYCFVAPISRSATLDGAIEAEAEPGQAHNLPLPLTRIVGRADTIAAITAQLPLRRFITIVGPGGMGKSTVALAVADELVGQYRDGARFVDLAPLTDRSLVPGTIAAALGLPPQADDPTAALVGFLRNRNMLLLFDSCERVIDAAAAVTEQISQGAPGVHILATSREPLRVEGERVHRLAPLEIPPEAAALTAAKALAFPAVQLFVERVAATLDEFELTDADAPIVAEICRQLDGMALALELAAGRVDAFGVRGVAAHLGDRLRLLTRGRRTALPRHQTLAATLDWSYELLPDGEQVVFRRLGVFAGTITLQAASAVVLDVDIAGSEVLDDIANLVSKSLIVADVGSGIVHYRLLETTRAYVLEKLHDDNELPGIARRHASYFQAVVEQAETEWETRPQSDWSDVYGRHIDDVRAALDWAFSPAGDSTIGVAITVAAVPLWFQLSLLDECRARFQQAVASVAPGTSQDDQRAMQLYAALGAALLYTIGPGPETTAAWNSAREIAERLDDIGYRLRATWGLWVTHLTRGEFIAALAFAETFRTVAAQSPESGDSFIGDRMIGVSLVYLGRLTTARQHIERMLAHYVHSAHASHIVRIQVDQRVTAQSFLAQILWLQGYADQAMQVIDRNVETAQATHHAISLSLALGESACPIALAVGDLVKAERFVTMFLGISVNYAFGPWRPWSLCYQAVLFIKRGNISQGLPLLQVALDDLARSGWTLREIALLGALAEALAQAGDSGQALAVIDDALLRSNRNQEFWCVAELLRIKGMLLLSQGTPDAQEYFLQSLDWARRQGALAWELRTAVSLARLWQAQHRIAPAREMLQAVHDRFTEGFGTIDMIEAKALLQALASDSHK